MAQTKTRYLGIDLPHPIIPGAGPLADDLDGARRLEDAGAPLITLRSLFEEQIVQEQVAHDRSIHSTAGFSAEASTHVPESPDAVFGPDEYLEHIRRVREAVSIPVVASLNGRTDGGWVQYAQLIEQAGAAALELNIYDLPTDLHRGGASIENEAVRIARDVAAGVKIKIAVKLSPFYTSLPDFARRMTEIGADSLVLFNRFYQPDIDIDTLESVPQIHLSDSSELLLRLRWLAILSGRLRCNLAVTGGVHTPTDAIKAVMCGARAVQVVSALLRNGPAYLRELRQGFEQWMNDHEYESLEQMCGSMNQQRCPNPSVYERANYLKILQSWQM